MADLVIAWLHGFVGGMFCGLLIGLWLVWSESRDQQETKSAPK